jgi:hypothetical protein
MKFIKAFILFISVHFAHAQVNCVTTGDQLGPYFKWGAPYIANDTLAPGVLDTTRSLELTFFVSYDCDTVDLDTLPSTYTLQIWHANDSGAYSNVDGNPNNYHYRGELELMGYSTTLHTTLPGIYPNRPSHIHIKSYLTDAHFTDTLITQLYFEGDSLIQFDGAINMPERWIRLDTIKDRGYRGEFAFGLSYIIGVEEEAGPVKRMYPNPTTGLVQVEMRTAGTITVSNLAGQIVHHESLGQGNNRLNLRHLPKGVYVLSSEGISRRFVLK